MKHEIRLLALTLIFFIILILSSNFIISPKSKVSLRYNTPTQKSIENSYYPSPTNNAVTSVKTTIKPTEVKLNYLNLEIDHNNLIGESEINNIPANWTTYHEWISFPSDWDIRGENYFVEIFKNDVSTKIIEVYFYKNEVSFDDSVFSRQHSYGNKFTLNGHEGRSFKEIIYLNLEDSYMTVQVVIILKDQEIYDPDKYSEFETIKKIINTIR